MFDEFKKKVKEEAYVPTWYKININRNISPIITKILLLTPISANQVSLLMILTGLIAAVLFVPGTKVLAIIGAVLLILQHTLDACDGEVARYRKQTSLRGKYLDIITHYLTEPLLFIGIMFGLLQTNQSLYILLAGLSASFFVSLVNMSYFARKYVIVEEIAKTGKGKQEEQYGGKPNILLRMYRVTFSILFRWPEYHFVILLGAIFGKLEWLLYFYGIGYALLFLLRVVSEYFTVPHNMDKKVEKKEIPKAVVFAAGKGSRIKEIAEGKPKCLLDLGGTTIIENLLDCLAVNDVKEVVIVLGYEAEQIQRKVGKEYKGMTITYVINKEYESTNTCASFYVTKGLLVDGCIHINGDNVMHPDIIKILLESDNEDVFLYDPDTPPTDDDAKVQVDEDGFMKQISKEMDPKDSVGWIIGSGRLSSEGVHQILDVIDGNKGKWLKLNIPFALCHARFVKLLSSKSLPFGEVDDKNDLEKVRKEVYPKIKEALLKFNA